MEDERVEVKDGIPIGGQRRVIVLRGLIHGYSPVWMLQAKVFALFSRRVEPAFADFKIRLPTFERSQKESFNTIPVWITDMPLLPRANTLPECDHRVKGGS